MRKLFIIVLFLAVSMAFTAYFPPSGKLSKITTVPEASAIGITNIVSSGSPPAASGDPGLTGSITGNCTAGDGNFSITVPSDADITVLLASGYSGTADNFSGGSASLCDSDCSSNCQSFTIRSDHDSSGTNQQSVIYALESPSSGTRYVCFDWVNNSPSEGTNQFAFSISNANGTQNWVEGGDSAASATHNTGSLTASSGDFFVGIADTYDVTAPDTDSITWTNATDTGDGQACNSDYAEVATETLSGATTVSVTEESTYSTLSGLVIDK